MITGTLKVDSQVLKNTADSFKQQSDSIRSLTTQMIDEVTAMNGAWESDAQQTYCQLGFDSVGRTPSRAGNPRSRRWQPLAG